MDMWEFTGPEAAGVVTWECGNKWCGQISHSSTYPQWGHQETDTRLSAWTPTVEGSGDSVMWWGAFCRLGEKDYSKSIQAMGNKGSLNGTMCVENLWIICCGLFSCQIQTPATHRTLILPHHHKNMKYCFILPVRFQKSTVSANTLFWLSMVDQ